MSAEVAPRLGMVKVQLWGYRCFRCEHEWLPRVTSGDRLPKVCPLCKSPYWDTPRKSTNGSNS